MSSSSTFAPFAALPVRPTLTIGVLTKNEASRIDNCLHSAAFADEVIVIDSGSTDDTVTRAMALNARVFVYSDWQGFSLQRNRLLMHATGDFVFFLDADEVVTPALRAQIEAAVSTGTAAVGRVQWRMVAFGHELRRFLPQVGPERLFRRDMVSHFEGVVHEQAILHAAFVDAPRHVMRGDLLHYSRETVRGSLEKLTQYAMLGAAKRGAAGKRGGVWRGIASGTSMFLRLYVFRLGFLCGGAGFLYCFFIALEGFFRYAALGYDGERLDNQVGR